MAVAWLKATENGLCSVVAKYTSPCRSELITDYCGSTDSYTINDLVVKGVTTRGGDRPNLKEVRMEGKIRFTLRGELSETTKTDTLAEMLFAGMLGASVLYGVKKDNVILDRSIESLVDYIYMLSEGHLPDHYLQGQTL